MGSDLLFAVFVFAHSNERIIDTKNNSSGKAENCTFFMQIITTYFLPQQKAHKNYNNKHWLQKISTNVFAHFFPSLTLTCFRIHYNSMDCLKSAAESRCECTRKWPHCLGVQAPLLTGPHPHPLFLLIQTGFLFEIFLYFFPDENRSAEFGLHQMHPTGSSSLPAHSIHLLSYLDDQPNISITIIAIVWMIDPTTNTTIVISSRTLQQHNDCLDPQFVIEIHCSDYFQKACFSISK